MYWWLNLIELVTWVAFTAGMLTALVAIALHPTGWALLASYIGYMCVMSWVRSIHYLRGAAMVGLVDRVLTFLAAPLYALLNITLLLPLRLWSLATLRRTKWGTRTKIEVGADIEAPEGRGGAPTAFPAIPHQAWDGTTNPRSGLAYSPDDGVARPAFDFPGPQTQVVQ
ncbi:hypothetical protein [Streptomyces sp. NPDC002346]